MSYITDTSTPASKVIHLDSAHASINHIKDDEGNVITSDFVYYMNEAITCPDHLSMLCSLHSATIPYSFYNIREGVNDKIDIIVSVTGFTSPKEHVLTLEAGNYTAISLATQFKQKLEYALANNPGQALPSIITINYDRDKQKFQFSILPTINDGLGRMVVINLSHGQNQGTQHPWGRRTWAVAALLTVLVDKRAASSTRELSMVLGQARLPGEPRPR